MRDLKHLQCQECSRDIDNCVSASQLVEVGLVQGGIVDRGLDLGDLSENSRSPLLDGIGQIAVVDYFQDLIEVDL